MSLINSSMWIDSNKKNAYEIKTDFKVQTIYLLHVHFPFTIMINIKKQSETNK